MTNKILQAVLFYISLLLGLIFTVSSLGKLVDVAGFAANVADYGLLPAWALSPFAHALAWTEFICGLALLFRCKWKGLSLLVAGMLCCFLFAISAAMWKGLEIDCGCFPVPFFGPTKTGWLALARTGFLLFFSLLLVIFKREKTSLS